MNIFVLDLNPEKAAQYHCDKHVVKMVLETAQILSTVAIEKFPTARDVLYRPTHRNHPCTIWARESQENILWLSILGLCLCKEFTYRYDKNHKSQEVIIPASGLLLSKHAVKTFPKHNLTPFAQAMPNDYKNGDVVKAYRDYYRYEKTKLLTYTRRRKPQWLE